MSNQKSDKLQFPKYRDGDNVLFCTNGENYLGYCCNVPAWSGGNFVYQIKQVTTGALYCVLERDILGKISNPIKAELERMSDQKEFDISCVKLHLSKNLFYNIALQLKDYHHRAALNETPQLRDELIELFDNWFNDAITLSKMRP